MRRHKALSFEFPVHPGPCGRFSSARRSNNLPFMKCGWPNLLQQCPTLIHTNTLRLVIGRLLQKSHSDWISKTVLLHSDARALGSSIRYPLSSFGLDPHWIWANFLFADRSSLILAAQGGGQRGEIIEQPCPA